MQSPWRDPPEPEEPPRDKLFEFLAYLAAALIGVAMIVNLARGVLGMGWNW